MAIEKMMMINMVAPVNNMDVVTKNVVLTGMFHPINALEEINSGNFKISTTEDNLDTLIDVNYVRSYSEKRDYSKINKEINNISQIVQDRDNRDKKFKNLIFDYSQLQSSVEEISDKYRELHEELTAIKAQKEKLEEYKNNLKYISKLDIPMEHFSELKNFEMQLYKINDEKLNILKANYENIPAIVDKVYKGDGYAVILVLSIKELKIDSDRMLNSLNCEKIDIPMNYEGNPNEVMKKINEELKEVSSKAAILEKNIDKFYNENKQDIEVMVESFDLEKSSSKLKEYVAYSNEFFYLSGWVPKSSLKSFEEKIKNADRKIIILEKKTEEMKEDLRPPTKLKNNFLVKPFEMMVNMYGVPTYEESDPTTFLALTYMIMFGAMFGDVGQGAILFLAGLLMKYKMNNNTAGGILQRLGITSTIFGFLYGSIFGFEHVIKPILISPMENIETVLIAAIIFGCGILLVGFVYGIVNSIKSKNLEEGLFGHNGLAGMAFYVLLLLFAYSTITSKNIVNTGVLIVLLVVLMALMVLKQPLTNLLMKKGFTFSEKKSDYFIESGFGALETLLSMFSNTLSFIRVGAFVLNHVGLFIAFSALANMMSNSAGSIFMYILGNVIIIVLEGLIVLIQGLRLEYYELFSKYYDGSGLEFKPITINNGEYI